MSDLPSIVEDLGEKVPEIVKNNKGALVGALIGYFITNSEQAKSIVLGAIAGSVIGDKKVKGNDDGDEEDE